MEGTIFECELYTVVEVKILSYTPYRPAPPCSNPDHPDYSDPGEDEEIEYEVAILHEKKKWNDVSKTTDTFIERILLPDELYPVYEEQINDELQKQIKLLI